MNNRNRYIKIVSAIVLLTAFLSWFFYAHENLPKPIRAATALVETPVAIASGLSHYLNLGVVIYESPFAIVLSNFIAAVLMVFIVDKILKYRTKQKIKH